MTLDNISDPLGLDPLWIFATRVASSGRTPGRETRHPDAAQRVQLNHAFPDPYRLWAKPGDQSTATPFTSRSHPGHATGGREALWGFWIARPTLVSVASSGCWVKVAGPAPKHPSLASPVISSPDEQAVHVTPQKL